jgi:diguanylate cyclase (GGDEF)-like protein
VRSLSARVTLGLSFACVIFALVATALGVVGIVGVRSAIGSGNDISRDELATASSTAALSQQLDATYASGQQLLSATDPTQRAQLTAALYNQQIPAVESKLGDLQRQHAGDGPEELAGINQLGSQWVSLRTLLNQEATTTGGASALSDQLRSTFLPLNQHLTELIDREDTDGTDDQAQASSHGTRIGIAIAIAVGVAILMALGFAWIGGRRLRRALEPAQDQVEFADTLQFAENEDEAQQLLRRHLERTVTGGAVTVLNRNNSADRLEAVTELPAGSPLAAALVHAAPRSCLAVRSARTHDEDDNVPALLGCPICSTCPGRSTCTPLTVGGEVIGAVLVNRADRYSTIEVQRIRDSVSQAAPVLANLRNLAIAELRAATDSLTGLPNKRAVTDTLKRMLAQASRTFSPLSLLLLDLDHFKDVNDRFGHPVGDQALAGVGAALRSVLRDSDFAGRNGGEEFAVMLPDTDTAGATLAAQKIRAAIAEISLAGLDVRITASIGVATYPEHAAGAERLERLADSALYLAKRSGRDRIEIATPGAESNQVEEFEFIAAEGDTWPQTSSATTEPVGDSSFR